MKLLNFFLKKSPASTLILIAIAALAAIGIFVIIAGLAMMGANWGERNTGKKVAGLCENVPEPYQTIFAQVGDKWKVQPAFLAAIFYAGEHGNSWPKFEEHASLGSSLNPNPHDCGPSGDNCVRGPMQIREKNWPSWSKGAYGNALPLERIEWTRDAIYVATWHLSMIGAGGNTTDESKLTEAAAKYNGGNTPPAYSYEVYAKKVLTAYKKFYCPVFAGECSESIIEQAKKYVGIPYCDGCGTHCGPNTIGPAGVSAVDCSGFISRVYRDLGLFPEGTCLTVATLSSYSNLKEISASEIKTGDIVTSYSPNHVVIYVSGDVTKKFKVWQSGGDSDNVHESLRDARQNQRYFRAKKCD